MLSLDSMKLVHCWPALRFVVPVILIVAVLLSAVTVPSPVTTPFSTLPVVKPNPVVLFQVTSPGPRRYKSLTSVSSLPVNVKSVFSPV